jgi:hypothetical protein
MIGNSETTITSTQFAQILSDIKQLTEREQLTLAKLILEGILHTKAETQGERPADFNEATVGVWNGAPLVRESQGDYEERVALHGWASAGEVITLSELKRRPIEQMLWEVAEGHQVLTVQLPSGAEIIIQLKPALKDLPVLEGYIPQGWKEAIYDDAA